MHHSPGKSPTCQADYEQPNLKNTYERDVEEGKNNVSSKSPTGGTRTEKAARFPKIENRVC